MKLACVAWATVALMLSAESVLAQDEAAETPEQPDVRLEYLVQRLSAYELRVGPDAKPATLQTQPVFRWKNPISGADGGVFVWLLDGRPQALAKAHVNDRGQHYVESCVALVAGVHMSLDGQTLWKPEDPEARQVTVDGVRLPVGSAPARLTQMRQLAGEFEFVDQWGEGDGERNELRLMPRPLIRYECPPSQVADGAIFGYSQGTNPEAVVVIEAIESPTGELAWSCSVCRLTGYALTAARQGNIVLNVPKNNATKPQEGYRHLWQKLLPYPFPAEE